MPFILSHVRTARPQLETAKAALATAEAALTASYLASDPGAEALATAKVNAARRDVAKAEAILIAASDREQGRAAQAQRAADAANDRAVVEAYKAQTESARGLVKSIRGYARHYQALVEAGDAARDLAAVNPRVRRDLPPPAISVWVANEIARASHGQDRTNPPGAVWPSASRDPASVTPLETQFENLAAAILP